MIVKTVMTQNVISVTPQTSLTDARAIMVKKGISKLPVLGGGGEVIGIITKNDLAKAGPSIATTLDVYEAGYLLSRITCDKIMTRKVISVDENEVIEEAARIMVDEQVGCLPVMAGDIMCGIITESDLFHLFTEMFGARQKGVRVNLAMSDKVGQIAAIASKIASRGGNIISIVTRQAKEEGVRRITIKTSCITIEEMQEVLKECALKADDIRVC